MKKLITALLIIEIFTGHLIAMEPAIAPKREAESYKRALYWIIDQIPAYETNDYSENAVQNDRWREKLHSITAMIQALRLDPGESIAKLIRNKNIGDSLYEFAKAQNQKATMNWLAQNRLVDAQSKFVMSILKLNKEEARYWLEYGADINMKYTNGNTILMNACSFREYTRIELLLSFNPDVNIPNDRGLTPLWLLLHQIIKYREQIDLDEAARIINLLLLHGAHTNIPNIQEMINQLTSQEREILEQKAPTLFVERTRELSPEEAFGTFQRDNE